MTMLNILFYLTITVMVIDWIAADRQAKKLRYLTKPGALILLILWFTQTGHWQGVLLWFGLALIFSLLGDIVLLLKPKLFLWGLILFLIAHIFYLVGLNQTLPPFNAQTLMVLVGVGAIAIGVFSFVFKGIQNDTKNRRLKIPLLIYGTVISLMTASAILNFYRVGWSMPTALLTSMGAALFFTSDSMIAIRNFVTRFNHDDYLVMLTYHLGQLMIIAGVLMQFVNQ
jgi:alkenylglycerophosphocholine/alkenylglycerophosphoethanolamine hydrolase